MILDRNTFDRIRLMSGYDRIEYQSSYKGLVRFLAYNGPREQPYRASIIDVNESFDIVNRGEYTQSEWSDSIGIHRVTYPQ